MFKRVALLSVFMLFGALLASAPALAAPPLSPAPEQVEFGQVDLHFGGSPTQTVKFSDEIGPIQLESVDLTGADAANFQIVSNGCSGELELGLNCAVEVAFQSGGVTGSHSATLELLTSNGVVEVPLSGSAVTGTLAASPNPLSFSAIPYTAPGAQNEGEYRESQQVNVQNSSDAGTQIGSVSITGPDASSFSIEYGNCQHNLMGPNNVCDVGIRFQPDSPGPKTASLVFESDTSGPPLTVALEGEGLHGPQLSVNTTQALLGDVPLGSSGEQAFHVANTGDYPLFIQRALLLTGTPLMFPLRSDTCSGQILYPTETCTFVVGFEPTTLGEKDAAILLITSGAAFNVLGIDGVGVSAASSAAMPAAPAPAPTPEVTVQGTHSFFPIPSERTRHSSQLLSVHRTPRLYTLPGRASVDTGVIAQCPPGLARCQVVSALTVSLQRGGSHAHAAVHSNRHTVLLGSTVVQLDRGQSVPLRVSLSKRAVALLKRRGRLHVTIESFIRAGGKIVSERTSTLTLRSPWDGAKVF
jgi:hypothetical protein